MKRRRSVAVLFVPVLFLSAVALPIAAYAQNICEVADTECPDPGPDAGLVPCVCPLFGLFTVAGVCMSAGHCQATGVFPTGLTTAGMIVGGAAVGGAALSMLLSGSGSSGNTSSATPFPAAGPVSAPQPVPVTPASLSSPTPLQPVIASDGAPPADAGVAATPAAQSSASDAPASNAVAALNDAINNVPPAAPTAAAADTAKNSAAVAGGSSAGQNQSSPTNTVALSSQTQTPLPFDISRGLWGAFAIGGDSAVISVDQSRIEYNQTTQFYSSAIGGSGTSSAELLCMERPWANSVYGSVVPPDFFDKLCTIQNF